MSVLTAERVIRDGKSNRWLLHRVADERRIRFQADARPSPLLDITRITNNQAGQPFQLLCRVLNPRRVHIADHGLPIAWP
ncbi:hypothetical protein AB0K05_25155 [Nonomuraea sp. NPDC049486]|uniref:hypothetical protein n=1 Tax=Nonomuraea sp. NPDC049486 TaxID=3155773 RepID=UPI003431A023